MYGYIFGFWNTRTTLRSNLDPDNLKWMLTQNKQGDLKPRCRPIIVNVVACCHRDRAKLHFAEKQMKLTENKENGIPGLAARTTDRRKGNPDMERG